MNRRGFSTWPKEKHLVVCSMGGRAAQAKPDAQRFTTETGREAGRKGGSLVSARPGHMGEMGRKGGAKIASVPGHMSRIGKRGAAKRRAMALAKQVAESFESMIVGMGGGR